ncbi:MAG: choice-of-anchor Q domain-containing protein [Planctomycetia bacterium]
MSRKPDDNTVRGWWGALAAVARRPRGDRFRVEQLEDRSVPATFVVANAADAGAGSLRDAIAQANALPDADQITFDAAVFGTPQTITLASGTLTVAGPVQIVGPGASLLTITQGAGGQRLFTIDNGSPGVVDVGLSGATLTGGSSTGDGGAILSNENLTLADAVFTGNTAAGRGGAIYQTAGLLTIQRATLANNTAASGGAVQTAQGASLFLDASTVRANSATGFGGGVYTAGGGAIQNSTIHANQAGGDGGGVFNEAPLPGPTLTIRNSTVSSNRAGGNGGGVANENNGDLALVSTILGDNTAGFGADLFSNLAATARADFSLVENPNGFGVLPGGNNLLGVDPLLTPIADNGGPTLTQQLQIGSPALNVGSNPAGLAFDQRGPGFPRLVFSQVDMGAVEGCTPRITVSGADLVIDGCPDPDVILIAPGSAPGFVAVTTDGNFRGQFPVTGAIIVNADAGDDTITVDAAILLPTQLSGGEGNDVVTGGGGPSVLNGDAGADRLVGNAQADALSGGAGNDTLDGGAGGDVLNGNDGADVVVGGDGDDTLTGGTGDDTLTGGTGNDTLTGDAGNDGIDGGTGDDVLNGVGGADALTGGDGADVLDGGSENDRLDGGNGADVVRGGAGDDAVNGNDGADQLAGGDGADVLQGGSGNDSLAGDGGTDRLSGNDGDDVLDGGAGVDLVNGDAGDDDLAGGSGEDTLNGGLGIDRADGGSGDDVVNGNDGDDDLFGGTGQDRVFGGAGEDLVSGGDNNDRLEGGAGGDLLDGGDGADVLRGGDDADILDGDADAGSPLGTGPRLVSFGEGDDQLFGDAGNDELFGAGGDDQLTGGDGADDLRADESRTGRTFTGDDVLDGGGGNDLLVGGAGDDVYRFENNWRIDFMQELAGGGRDVLDFTRLTRRVTFQLGSDSLPANAVAIVNGTTDASQIQAALDGVFRAIGADLSRSKEFPASLARGALLFDTDQIESLLGGSGDDTVRFVEDGQAPQASFDGKGGVDSLDYTLSNLDSIAVNLAAGVATGLASVRNVEQVFATSPVTPAPPDDGGVVILAGEAKRRGPSISSTLEEKTSAALDKPLVESTV